MVASKFERGVGNVYRGGKKVSKGHTVRGAKQVTKGATQVSKSNTGRKIGQGVAKKMPKTVARGKKFVKRAKKVAKSPMGRMAVREAKRKFV